MIVKTFYLSLQRNNILQNMDEKKYQELPKRVVIRQARLDANATLQKAVSELQAAWSDLQGVPEIKPLPTELNRITPEWLYGIISRRTALIEKDESLTEGERENRLHAWISLKARCTRYINTINRVTTTWPGIWSYDTIMQTFFVPDIEAVADEQATRDTPEDASKHWGMIQEIIAKVKELRQWENKHDVITQPLCTFEGMPPTNFAELWASGDIKYNRSFAHLGINPQNPQHLIF